ncbi:MAG: enoyl-ACP reductase FabV [Hyalangium sp.]|uniref:enoyl-ACP reductase FabV n=1 Tax=Hyalangium sp. TaxID=2028555 RepID=UPI003899F727
MIVEPVIRGSLCATSHPEGCVRNVEEQVQYVRGKPALSKPSRVLVIGCSSGLGLASRITAAFGARASTVGICHERPGQPGRLGTAGWYKAAAFEEAAQAAGLSAYTLVGDAYSEQVKRQTVELIREKLGKVELVVYSLASPRRTDPVTGQVYTSTLKTVGPPFTEKAVDFKTGEVSRMTIEPATEDGIRQTVAVMGGEDWELWMKALEEADVLERGAVTVAYSYLGGERLKPTYRGGTIGKAKDHLEATAKILDARLRRLEGRAYIAVMKALVTQSSAVLPMSSLYTILLFRVMKEKGLHEGPIEQAYRLFSERLYGASPVAVDEEGRIRLDDLELRGDVQEEVARRWEQVTTENLPRLGDREAFYNEFLRIHGFAMEGVDYSRPVEPVRRIPSVPGP